MDKQKLLDIALGLCSDNGVELVYLTVFGSHLYGTNTGGSDLDCKGVYLPSIQSLILGTDRERLISDGLAGLDEIADGSRFSGNWDQGFVDDIILRSYK